jgi:hypothetical protein
VPIFLSTGDIIDVTRAVLGRNFDIRLHFLAAAPVVMYVKWAFGSSCWQAAEIAACLVIDDPLLKPRYGFLNFERLLKIMDDVDFSTSIAFIPWNSNRSTRKVVQVFKENRKRFSLSVHGCDHVGGEFGIRNSSRLAWKSRQALNRMAQHQCGTGLPYDPVMIFPQGVFSELAMSVLKSSDFIAVVNTEVIAADAEPRTIRIADCWNVAVMKYSDFPVYTRRYLSDGIENFAFDILLGKPCIIVAHHNECSDDCLRLGNFVKQLNELNVRLIWTNLAEVVRRSFRQREISSGIIEIEIYGSETRIENSTGEKKTYRVRKQEAAPASIKEIRAAGELVNWRTANGNQVTFEVELGLGETKTVVFRFKKLTDDGFAGENFVYRAKTMLRRYLCEMRDNYIARCHPSALMRQIGWVEEGRISGSS